MIQRLIPFVIVPAMVAAVAGVFCYRILPLGSIPYVAALVGLVVVGFGFHDRAHYAAEDGLQFSQRVAVAYAWVLPWAGGGWLIALALGMDPPWPALFGVGLGIAHARRILAPNDSPRTPKTTIQRGPELRTFEEIREQGKLLASSASHGLIWGGVPIPNKLAHLHFLVCGTTGSGKTKTLQLLMESVVRRVQPASNCRALIYDAKGDMPSYLAALRPSAPVHILNVLDQRGVAWDMAADMTSHDDATQLADTLCPVNDAARDPFYPKATRALLKSIVLALSRLAPAKWSLRDIINAANLENIHLQMLLNKFPDLEQLMRSVFKAKELPSVRISLTVALDDYVSLAGAWEATLNQGRRISLKRWLRESSVLLLPNRPDQAAILGPLNRLLMEHLAAQILADSESSSRQTWLFLDELADLGKVPRIPDLLAKGRSKGVCAAIGFQELAGLQNKEKGYGDHDTDRIVSQCNHVAFLRAQDAKTAEWASAILGDQERLVMLKTRSTTKDATTTGENQHLERVRVVLPSELQNLPPCSPQNGLHGYYSSPCFNGCWHAVLPSAFISRSIASPADDVPDFIPHPQSYPCLPWNADDYARLNLKDLFDECGDTQPATPNTSAGEHAWKIQRLRRAKTE